jgi:DMSO/TMAO reductase YedYZ molybdopterin-dependent catalytic subunit
MNRPGERSLIADIKPDLVLFDTDEINAETPAHLLDDDITPVDRLFVRNTGRMPSFSPAELSNWRLTIDGLVDRPQAFGLDALKRDFAPATETAVIECAGNGRAYFEHATSSPPWTQGAVGCVQWTGLRLADLLNACGVKNGAVYTAHHAPDANLQGDGPAISRGLPIEKAMAPETLIAFALNGAPIPLLHGGPLRVVAPGYPGSAWQKWITRIEIRDREHDGERMTGQHYRMPRRPLRPGEPADGVPFDVITDMPVRSIVTSPADGFTTPADRLLPIRGHAWSGHVPVDRVDVSIDGGETWHRAALAPVRDRFAWRRFEIALTPRPGRLDILARATDIAGHSQPLRSAPWNPRGYCNNAMHRVAGSAR